jgi:hypothetical protein
MRRPRTPEGLGDAGTAFWRGVMRVYELSPSELVTLEQCCRQLDLVARLDEAVAVSPLLVKGSMGQVRTNPLVATVAEARRTLDTLQRSLALPMPDEVEGSRRAPQQIAAAQARWRARRG